MFKVLVLVVLVSFFFFFSLIDQVNGQNFTTSLANSSTSTASNSNTITITNTFSPTKSSSGSGTLTGLGSLTGSASGSGSVTGIVASSATQSITGLPVAVTASISSTISGSGTGNPGIPSSLLVGASISATGAVAASVSASGGAVAASVSASGGVVGASASFTGTVSQTEFVGASGSAVGVSGSSLVSATGQIPSSISASSSISLTSSPSNTRELALASPSSDVQAPPQVFSSGAPRPQCGNGIIEAGEACDSGTDDPRTHCCTSLCTYLEIRSKCGEGKAGACRVAAKCRRSRNRIICDQGRNKPEGQRCGGLFSKKTCDANGTCTKR